MRIRSCWNGELLGYLDDDAGPRRSEWMRVFGALNAFEHCPAEFFRGLGYVTAVGGNAVRRTIVVRLRDSYGERFAPWTLVHPGSYVGKDVEIGDGTCL